MTPEPYFAMGGYAAYVWPAYATAAVIMIALLISSWRHMRSGEAKLNEFRAAMTKENDQ